MTAHSNIGASSMYRWSACPGSVRLSEGVEKKSSRYADEGSDAHELAAMCLRGGFDAAEFVDRHIIQGGRDFTPAAEMAEAVQVYVDQVRAILAQDPEHRLFVEQRFDLSDVHAGCFGTSDAVVWLPKTETLVVVDYKHGAGVPVKVESNPQLQYYGLGAFRASQFPAKKVRLVIVQPRCEIEGHAVREWDIDTIDLLDFQADLKAYAIATEDPNAPLNPGDHCRFCPAAALCPALANKAQEVARMEFSATPILGFCGAEGCGLPVRESPHGSVCAKGHGGAPIVPAPTGVTYDAAKLKLALDSRDVVKAWLKALDEFAYAEAEAGRPPPGYKLVAKRATRKWRDEGAARQFLHDAKWDRDSYIEESLKSPAQIEKVGGKPWMAKLQEFIVAESSGHVLVPEADKRPAVSVGPQAEFAPVTVPGSNVPVTDKDLLDIPGHLKSPSATKTVFD